MTAGYRAVQTLFYREHEQDLAPEERLRFAPGEEGPDFDPARAPRVEGPEWPADRLAKVARNYCRDYVRTMLAELPATLGPAETRALGHGAAVQIGMQYHAETAALLGVRGDGPEDFAAYLVGMAQAQGDDAAWTCQDGEVVVEQSTWRLMRGVGVVHPAAFDVWTGLWEGALAVHNRRLVLTVSRRLDLGDDRFEWRIRRRRPARPG